MKNNNQLQQPFEHNRRITAALYYDVLVFGAAFEWFELSETVKEIHHQGNRMTLDGQQLFFNGEEWTGAYYEGYQAFALGELSASFTNLPQTDFLVSATASSAIQIETGALAHFVWKEHQNYWLQIFANGYPVYLNGQPVTTFDGLFKIGDRLVLDGVLIERRPEQFRVVSLLKPFKLDHKILTEETQKIEYSLDFPEFRRSPRIYLREPEDKVTITPPKAKKERRRGEILRTIVPPLGMIVMTGAVALISRRNPIMLMGMGGASLLTAGFSVSSFLTNRKETEKENKLIEERYQNYLVETASKLAVLAEEQIEALDYNQPSIDQLVKMVQTYSPRLYEKSPRHEDFLNVRLGLGTIDSSYSVDFSDRDQADDWADFVKQNLVTAYQTIDQAPIIIPLREQTLGLAGSPFHLTIAAQTVLFQLAAMHSYHDVAFIALVSEKDYHQSWSDWRWLPHFQLSDLNLRGFIYNEQTRDVVLASFYQIIAKRRQILRESSTRNQPLSFSPHYILTILDDSYLLGHNLNELLAEDMSQYGVTVIWGKETLHMLPETATAVVDYQNSEVATLIINNKEYVNQLVVPNRQSEEMTMSLQRLANLEHIEAEKNALPDAISFLALYGVTTVDELAIETRWAKADTSKTLAVPLGVRGKDDLVYLNLHERAHGPHGLVAGTTGSGKSEILQSYILSLAVNFSPEDVGFLPIDFKGGGMANLFKQLPHLMGSITNLDGAASDRALKSIRAELHKRQREFGKFDVAHINGYTKLYKEGQRQTDPEVRKTYPQKPLPHLFLISDEFAELKANEPEFMTELVSTARIGRSLGVHLILATQKPSGVVDDQIWSNSRFKLALKVADTSDSNEIIKTPDAASIVQPGRAYLQVGHNEIYELFQSAWSGAPYQPDVSDDVTIDERIWVMNTLGQPELLSADLSADEDFLGATDEVTELEAVIEAIVSASHHQTAIIPDKPWLPPLEEEIVTPKLDHRALWQEKRTLSIPLGYLDLPEQQTQKPFTFDLEAFSHFAIMGSAGFGKSTALQTFVMNLARSNSPEQVHIYLLDFGTNGLLPLKDLPHVADIVTLPEEEKLVKYIKKIKQDIQVRKDAFAAYGVATLAQYEAKSGHYLPVIAVILDGYDTVQDSSLSEAIDSIVAQVLREGAGLGIYLVMSALRANSFRLAINSTLPTRIALFLVEENGVREVIGREALIAQEVLGRAQIKLETGVSEFQFYLPAAGDNDIERLMNMEQEIQALQAEWRGETPDPIPMLPRVVELADFYKHPDVLQMLADLELPLAFDKESTAALGFKPKEHGWFLIAEDTAQQSDYLTQTLMSDFSHLAGKVTRVIFNAGGRFSHYNESFDVFIEEAEYMGFLTDLATEIDERAREGWSEVTFIYIPEAHLLTNHLLTALDLFHQLLDQGPKYGIYPIFQGIQRTIESAFDDFNKRLRSNIPAGIFGTRVTDQNLLNVKIRVGEPIVALDEAYFFEVREIKSIKLNQ